MARLRCLPRERLDWAIVVVIAVLAVVIDQAENRLHTIKAVLVATLS